jgi:hypothetical protein
LRAGPCQNGASPTVKHHRGHRICMGLYLVTYQHQRRLVGIVIVSAGWLEEARLHSVPELGEASLDQVLPLDDEIAAGVPSHFVGRILSRKQATDILHRLARGARQVK